MQILNHVEGEVLDLTKGVTTDANLNNELDPIGGDNQEAATGAEDTGTADADGVVVEETPDADKLPEEGEGKKEGDDATPESEDGDAKHFIGDQAVDVTVPDDIAAQLVEAGVEPDALIDELFAKGSNFELKDETRSKLEEKFGKGMVDGYLNLYKMQNEQTMATAATDKKAADDLLAAQGAEYSALVGGEEGLVALESFIQDSYSDDELDAYNAVMETGDHASQLLVLNQAKKLQAMTDKLENGDKSVKLLGDGEASSNAATKDGVKGSLTLAEYDEIMLGDKYWTDAEYAAKVDNARNVGRRSE